MKRFSTHLLSAALIAAGGLAASAALAADDSGKAMPGDKGSATTPDKADTRSDKKAVVPSREAVQNRAMQPSNSVLDDNAQRQHDRDQAAAPNRSGASGGSTQTAQAGTRDWNQIDSNNDHLVSPDEMESWLQKNRPSGSAAVDRTAAPKQ